MLATAQLWAMADGGPTLAASIPSILEMPVPQVGAKCWCCTLDQGVPTLRQDEEEVPNIDDIPKEHPHKKQKDGRLVGNALKEAQRRLFLKNQTL